MKMNMDSDSTAASKTKLETMGRETARVNTNALGSLVILAAMDAAMMIDPKEKRP